jgi:hypothetical protein
VEVDRVRRRGIHEVTRLGIVPVSVVAAGERDGLDAACVVALKRDLLAARSIGHGGREVGVVLKADLGIDAGQRRRDVALGLIRAGVMFRKSNVLILH